VLAAEKKGKNTGQSNTLSHSRGEPAGSLQSSTRSSDASSTTRARKLSQQELEAFQAALPELIKLERYERRAIARRNRAIRLFEAFSTFDEFTKGANCDIT
jgi:hypothetical protein